MIIFPFMISKHEINLLLLTDSFSSWHFTHLLYAYVIFHSLTIRLSEISLIHVLYIYGICHLLIFTELLFLRKATNVKYVLSFTSLNLLTTKNEKQISSNQKKSIITPRKSIPQLINQSINNWRTDIIYFLFHFIIFQQIIVREVKFRFAIKFLSNFFFPIKKFFGFTIFEKIKNISLENFHKIANLQTLFIKQWKSSIFKLTNLLIENLTWTQILFSE